MAAVVESSTVVVDVGSIAAVVESSTVMVDV